MVKRTRPRRPSSRKVVVTCKQATSVIVDYVSGELDAKTARAFERHLLECPDCVSFLNTYKKSIQAVRSLQYRDIPSALKRRVSQFLRERIKGE